MLNNRNLAANSPKTWQPHACFSYIVIFLLLLLESWEYHQIEINFQIKKKQKWQETKTEGKTRTPKRWVLRKWKGGRGRIQEATGPQPWWRFAPETEIACQHDHYCYYWLCYCGGHRLLNPVCQEKTWSHCGGCGQGLYQNCKARGYSSQEVIRLVLVTFYFICRL